MNAERNLQRLLAAAILLLAAVVWLEPAGSSLAEPDETRYAEIPREMLAAGDLVVPRLNGVPYLEKPPLLYWSNAGAFVLFGQTPWAARLPTRLAGLGSALLLLFGVGAFWGRATGLAAAAMYLLTPMGFLFSRVNLTDGMLSFFFAATLLLARAALVRRSEGKPALLFAVSAAAAAAGAFLAKGLIGLVLPGAILFAWCLATRRLKSLVTLGLFPVLPVFLALCLPWLLAAEARMPGFLQFFFVHEHFQRFATAEARRPGPVYYFLGVFAAGFLPALPFLAEGFRGLGRISRWKDEHQDALFFAMWFAVVFLFFTVSQSKLPPYLLPAFPAAAALAGRGLVRAKGRVPWILSAVCAALLAAAAALVPISRQWISDYGLLPIVLPAGGLLLLGSLAAVPLSRRGPGPATLALSAAWAAFFAAVALGWPKVPPATADVHLARAAASAARDSGARVVAYRTYLNAFSWELRTPIPVADYTGELEPEFEPRAEVRDALFWKKGRFWNEWASGRPLVVLVRTREKDLFENVEPRGRILAEERKHLVVANFP
ncbi:MAG TPA: phospholipid carrier-dependent glycosyltransferase [Thermoanaerobaculia bacterium]|nr:phospholipid carrier-dependent glycosyltransferase [Thermoanaerobaculia bacterium]